MLIHSPLLERAPSCRTDLSSSMCSGVTSSTGLAAPSFRPSMGARLSCERGINTLRPPVLQSLPAKTHPVTCSFESPWASSFWALLLCLALLRHLFTHIYLPGFCRVWVGDFSCMSQFLSSLSIFKPWLPELACRLCLTPAFPLPVMWQCKVTAQALTISGTDLRVCTAIGFYVANSLQSFGIN